MDGIEPPTQGFSILIIWFDMAQNGLFSLIFAVFASNKYTKKQVKPKIFVPMLYQGLYLYHGTCKNCSSEKAK